MPANSEKSAALPVSQPKLYASGVGPSKEEMRFTLSVDAGSLPTVCEFTGSYANRTEFAYYLARANNMHDDLVSALRNISEECAKKGIPLDALADAAELLSLAEAPLLINL